MKPSRNIRMPGRGKGRNAPAGYLVGRVSHGRGPLELIDQAALAALGIATTKGVAATTNSAGFRFYIGGRPGAGEEIGSGNWGHDVFFENGQTPTSVIAALVAATSSAVFDIKIQMAGVYTTIGTITVGAASLIGVLNWLAPVTITAGTPISLWAPAVQDTTLANITGSVYGSKA